jgi:hypothetical protein
MTLRAAVAEVPDYTGMQIRDANGATVGELAADTPVRARLRFASAAPAVGD